MYQLKAEPWVRHATWANAHVRVLQMLQMLQMLLDLKVLFPPAAFDEYGLFILQRK
jgi:hypothetical protein